MWLFPVNPETMGPASKIPVPVDPRVRTPRGCATWERWTQKAETGSGLQSGIPEAVRTQGSAMREKRGTGTAPTLVSQDF